MIDWLDMKTAPRDGTLVHLRYRWTKFDPWIETRGWFETGPADMCWYDEEDERIEPHAWAPIE